MLEECYDDDDGTVVYVATTVLAYFATHRLTFTYICYVWAFVVVPQLRWGVSSVKKQGAIDATKWQIDVRKKNQTF